MPGERGAALLTRSRHHTRETGAVPRWGREAGGESRRRVLSLSPNRGRVDVEGKRKDVL